jgi:Uma2 family endonuclease
VSGSSQDYLAQHPTAALLVVEVSDTTLAYDRQRKASLYARMNVADYWIVKLVDLQVEVNRKPVADATRQFGQSYADCTILRTGDRVTPLALPGVAVAVADQLP